MPAAKPNKPRPATQGRPLKDPLRSPAVGIPRVAVPSAGFGPKRAADVNIPGPDLRKTEISEFGDWLRTQTNKQQLPYQENAILAYTEVARVLDRWMTKEGIDGDFTACDTDVLNRFFADYRKSHTQGGTNTRQRNLHHLFKWLAKVHGHPDPWTEALVRYGPSEVPPSTLSKELITDIFEVTGNGTATTFAEARDEAIFRMLTEGVRREELAQMELSDLPEDLIANPIVRVLPLKGARASTQGRVVPLSMATARSLAAYLRVRRSHRQAALPALWLGTRNRGPMTGSGIYRMVRRRTLEAGYRPTRPHQYRHTFANDWLDGGGSEGDLMRLMGWKSRSMVDRYAKDMQVQRAVKAKQARGDMY